MEICICIALLLVLLIHFVYARNRNRLPLPPGPFPWPLVGSLFSLRAPLHSYFEELAHKYGPIFMLKVGTVPTIVISSWDVAEQLLLKARDVEFAHKPPISFFEYISFDFNDLTSAEGEALRKLKRICSIHVFSTPRLNALAGVRLQEMQLQVRSIAEQQHSHIINLSSRIHELVANITFVTLFGSRLYDGSESGGKDSETLVPILQAMEDEYTKLNLADVWPMLKSLDLQGKRHKWIHTIMPRFKEFLLTKVEEHRANRNAELASTGSFHPACFLDVLVSLEGEDELPDMKIIGLLSNLIVGGITTQEATLCWTFAELFRNPETMRKAVEEIDCAVGRNRMVEESDMHKLPMTTAIVKESMRLHYAVPLGSPHYNLEESELSGYTIPAKTTVFVNFWAIFHDPALWKEPYTFMPERFLHSNLGFMANAKFMPFSGGRRACVGYPLATRLLPLVVSTLLHCFDWSLPPGHDDMDMSSRFVGVNVMSSDLRVTATPRLKFLNRDG